jgi:hypothetical protein
VISADGQTSTAWLIALSDTLSCHGVRSIRDFRSSGVVERRTASSVRLVSPSEEAGRASIPPLILVGSVER